LILAVRERVCILDAKPPNGDSHSLS